MMPYDSPLLEQKNIHDLLKQIETCKSVSDVRVLRPKLLFVNGLVREVSAPEILERGELMGQYGKIVKTSVNKVKQNFYSAFVEYETEAEAALALLSLDNFPYKGKIVKVFYGSTKYCFSFLKGEECRIRQCAFSHRYQKTYTYFKANTASINHSKIAERILTKNLQMVNPRSIPSAKFPSPFKTLEEIKSLIESGSNSDPQSTVGTMPEQEWDQLQQQITSFVKSEGEKGEKGEKREVRKRTKVQEFLEYAEQKLYSLIFRSTVLDQDD